MKTTSQFKFLLKIYKSDGSIQRIQSKKKRRISHYIQVAKELEVDKFYICVSYEPIIDVFGKKVKAFNDGQYQTKQLLREAIKCFVEK